MLRTKTKYGLVTMCMAGGMGITVIYENIDNIDEEVIIDMTIKEKIYKWIDENEQKYIDKLHKIDSITALKGTKKLYKN